MYRRTFLAGTAALFAAPAVAAPMKTVTDDAGRQVTVPVDPRRIVSLYEALHTIPALELGLPVVGSFGRADDGGSLMRVDFLRDVLGRDGRAEGIVGTGPLGGLDLEKVRALQPDLILASELNVQMLGQLEKIAPTYVLHTRATQTSGFESQEKLARLTGRDARLAELHAAYQRRLIEVRERIIAAGRKDPRHATAMMVMVRDDIGVLRDLTGGMQALRDLGYGRLDWSKSGSEDAFGDGWRTPLSAEEFPRLNPDLMIAIDGFVGPENPRAYLSERLDGISPGWQRFMAPAQQDRMIFLSSSKIATTTVASAMHMLDAIANWAEGGMP